jgi:hypothetical protein
VVWQRAYAVGYLNALQRTHDGGFVAAGCTHVAGGDRHAWILALDADGSVAWQKIYSGSGHEGIDSIAQAADGGFAAAGSTTSFGAASQGNAWILRVSGTGDMPGCNVVTITAAAATVSDTSAPATDTSAVETDTTVVPEATDVIPVELPLPGYVPPPSGGDGSATTGGAVMMFQGGAVDSIVGP